MALTKHKSTMRFRKSSTAAAPRSHHDPSSVPRHVLSPSNTNSNGRRKSSMFPSPKSILKKRPKTTSCVEAVEYPTETNVPSKALIRALYDEAISDSSSNNQVELDEVGSGLLSLEQVLLPSVARMHADSLKQLQAKLQRQQQQQQHDATKDHIKAMEACRVALYQCVAVGMHQARESRIERDARLAEQWHDDKLARHQEVAQRREEARALQKQQRLVRAKQQCRVNRAAKQEGLNLMAQLAVLEKEERLWKEAQAQLRIRQEQLNQQQRNKAAAVDAVKCQDGSDVVDVQHVPQEAALQEAVQNITTSSVRIHQAVESVSHLLQQAQDIRKEVYETYKQDFQFHGYRGVTDSKGLFRAIMLSQQNDEA